jgi:hypothetical protein
MKTRFITSVMAIIMTSASLLAADTAVTVELLNQSGSSIYKVVYKAAGNGSALLKITNKSGLVFSERLTFTNGFTLPVDFKGMESGDYTVEVLSKNLKFKKTIAHINTIPVAYVRMTEQPGIKQLLTISSPIASQFQIRVLNSNNEELFSTVESVTNHFATLINLAQVQGAYHIEVTETAGNVRVVRK